MSYKFHDEDYDGIVLKISSGHLATNPEFIAALETFHKALEECKFSTFHRDYEMNLHELRNYKTKGEDIKAAKAELEKDRRERKEKEKKRLDELMSRKVLPITTKKIVDVSSNDYIEMDGVTYNVCTDILTRTSIKSSFKKAYTAFVNKSTKEQVSQFFKDNNILGFVMYDIDLNMVDFHSVTWGQDNRYNLRCTMEFVAVRVYQKGKRNSDSIYYYDRYLYYHRDLGYYLEGESLDNTEEVQLKSMGIVTKYICSLSGYNKEQKQFKLKE